jgi:hypothetical protein
MKRATVIRLGCDLREDGSIHVYSPDVPLVHIVGRDAEEAQRLMLATLKEHLARNYNVTAEIIPTESLESFLARTEIPAQVSAQVIAEMAA